MFINSFVFGIESNIRKNLDFVKKESSQLSTYALSGAISGFLSAIILTPIELIKIRMQMADSKYKNSLVCFLQTIQNEGIRKFSRGFTITAMRETPAIATYFVSFEFLLHHFKNHDNKDRESKVWELLIAGGVSGCLSWLMTYPIDVVKTRYQSDESHKSIRACYRELLLNEGRRGLWRGLSVTLLR
jgi:solute carrier family 25 (mitochondrial carnitine/acylcarnitine transporter), member 20/29